MLLTAIAMLAFAANSLLCRMALGAGLIDAASFTSVRIISGAVMLGLIVLPRLRSQGRPSVDLRAVAMLFAYMFPALLLAIPIYLFLVKIGWDA